MKKILLITVILSVLPLSAARAQELGTFFGGGIDLKDSFNMFRVGPYFSTHSNMNYEQRLHFFLPLAFGFETGNSIGGDAFMFSVTPTVEYDFSLYKRKLFLTPALGMMFAFVKQDVQTSRDLNSFWWGIVPTIQLKYILKRHYVFRLAPFEMMISPWRYSDNRFGSDAITAINYQMWAGFSYMW